jgi:RNA polymerase sigma-70 factor (ECF subfamily)
MDSKSSISLLIIQAKNGDKQAFSSLYNEFYTPLYRFVMSRTRDQEKAKDISQEVFLKWYESLERYEEKMKPLSYLMMIAMRLIINEGEKKKSLYFTEDAEEFIEDKSINIFEDLDLQIGFDRVRDLFTELSDDQRIILEFKYISDMKNSEISEMIGKTEEAIRKAESRALQKLREIYKQKYENNF